MHFAIDHDLARIFAFDAVDLAANRAGHLSPDQEVMLRNASRLGRRRTRRIVPLVVVLAGVMVALVLGTASEISVGLVAALLGGLTLVLGLMAVFVRTAERTYRAYERPIVRSVEGVALAEPSATPGSWWVRVGGVRFPVMSGDAPSFRDDTVHRVYYLDDVMGAAALLSAEVRRG